MERESISRRVSEISPPFRTLSPCSKAAFIPALSEVMRYNLGKVRAMAKSYRVGDEVYVNRFLKRCNKGDVVIESAMSRDPKASFDPIELGNADQSTAVLTSQRADSSSQQ